MTHIDEGTLQALLDDELHLEERRRTERHLEVCRSCRAELEELRSRAAAFSAAMGILSHEPRSREHAVGWPRAGRLSRVRRMLPRAAVLLLFAGAAASATVPGSPVRRWLEELPPASNTAQTTLPAAQVAIERPTETAPVESGVFVEAVDGRVEVVLRDAREMSVRAILVQGTQAGVSARGEATGSRFVTGPGRIEVLNPRSGDLRIEVPLGAPAASVIINGIEVLRKHGESLDLSTQARQLESDGIEFSVGP